MSDDGLLTATVRRWSLLKHRLLDLYVTLFSMGMKYQWGQRVYIDLFSGPGRARITGTKRIVETSPLIALRVPDPFDKYIFCDKTSDAMAALRNRVDRDFPEANASYLVGDCNELVDRIVGEIPKASSTRTVLSFCFADPYGIKDVKFQTIRRLSHSRMDFLILLALAMDANRFESLYVRETNRVVDDFLGRTDWRRRWVRGIPGTPYLIVDPGVASDRFPTLRLNKDERPHLSPLRGRQYVVVKLEEPQRGCVAGYYHCSTTPDQLVAKLKEA